MRIHNLTSCLDTYDWIYGAFTYFNISRFAVLQPGIEMDFTEIICHEYTTKLSVIFKQL